MKYRGIVIFYQEAYYGGGGGGTGIAIHTQLLEFSSKAEFEIARKTFEAASKVVPDMPFHTSLISWEWKPEEAAEAIPLGRNL